MSDLQKKDSKGVSSYGGIKVSTEETEFGGPIGVTALIIWSHCNLFYFWYCLEKNSGFPIIPTTWSDAVFHWGQFQTLFYENAIPSGLTWAAYFFFFVVQLILAATVPGLTMYGLPTAPDGKRLPYHCNGYWCYYICLIGFFVAHYLNWFNYDGTHLCKHYGEYLVASMIIADVTTVFWYYYGLYTTDPRNGVNTSSGSMIYDMFMGTILYPRIGEVDIKMIAEVRWSWLTLMLLTTSCALTQYQSEGRISKEIMVMLYAHWLYSNATVKGEQCIPPTWDMFHERFGWMLNFWNICGVPFLYCFQSFYIIRNQHFDAATNSWVGHSWSNAGIIAIFILLTIAYYIFDTANCQKASCKVYVKRNTFPQVPWAVLENPRFIKTPKGHLLVDGWYRFARKMQYTGDILMALSWGLACGFGSPMPYFYVFFFTCMIVHRQTRDEVRCKEKYGEFWDEYTKKIPNVFIPNAEFWTWLFGGKIDEVGVRLKDC